MNMPSRTTHDERCLHLRQNHAVDQANSSLDKPLQISTPAVDRDLAGQGRVERVGGVTGAIGGAIIGGGVGEKVGDFLGGLF
jgi:hypothetical protein